jgi:hypothetical protein
MTPARCFRSSPADRTRLQIVEALYAGLLVVAALAVACLAGYGVFRLYRGGP